MSGDEPGQMIELRAGGARGGGGVIVGHTADIGKLSGSVVDRRDRRRDGRSCRASPRRLSPTIPHPAAPIVITTRVPAAAPSKLPSCFKVAGRSDQLGLQRAAAAARLDARILGVAPAQDERPASPRWGARVSAVAAVIERRLRRRSRIPDPATDC